MNPAVQTWLDDSRAKLRDGDLSESDLWLCGRDETAAVIDCSASEGRGIPLNEVEP